MPPYGKWYVPEGKGPYVAEVQYFRADGMVCRGSSDYPQHILLSAVRFRNEGTLYFYNKRGKCEAVCI